MVSLRDYVDTRFESVQKDLDTTKNALTASTATFSEVVRRDEYDEKHSELVTRIGNIEARLANLMGKAVIWAILGSILMVVAGAFFGHLFDSK